MVLVENPVPYRVVVFIDGSNLYKTLKEIGLIGKIKYDQFVRDILAGFNKKVVLRRVYFYSAMPDARREPKNYGKTQSFLDMLRSWDLWEVKLGRLRYSSEGFPREKGVDVKLVTDMIEGAVNDLYDIAVLVSGDADFSYCFSLIKRLEKQVAVVKLPHNFSYQLSQEADYTIKFPYEVYE
ncbi:NYN domain-containing protein [bacterium]|nr:NYN domain-containing protein [bacterium]